MSQDIGTFFWLDSGNYSIRQKNRDNSKKLCKSSVFFSDMIKKVVEGLRWGIGSQYILLTGIGLVLANSGI
jgi:hypothetical protein